MLPLEEIVLEVFATPRVPPMILQLWCFSEIGSMLVYEERISSLTVLFEGDRERCEAIKVRMPLVEKMGILGTLCVPFLSFRTSQLT